MLPFDQEIERTLNSIRRANREELNMDENKGNRNFNAYSEGYSNHNEKHNLRKTTLCDYWKLMLNDNYFGIRERVINANNFELKLSLISMVQQQWFGGHSLEDLNAHLSNFLEFCSTIKMNGVDYDIIQLNLFPFSLKEKARNGFKKICLNLLCNREPRLHSLDNVIKRHCMMHGTFQRIIKEVPTTCV